MNYYFCDACHYCFTAEMLLDRCPDCGKQEVHAALRYGQQRKQKS